MNKRKNLDLNNNTNGITLIALVITIIVMLILAAVSINAAIGENGIITHAMKAQEETKLAQEKEELEFLITDFNTSMGLSTVDEFLNAKADPENPDRKLEDYYMIPDPEDPEDEEKMMRVCKLNGRFYRIIQDGEYFKVELINSDASNIGTGITIATKESFGGGTMNFDPGTGNNSMLVFNDKIDEEYNFNIVSGNATIYINDSMTLTNANVKDIDGNGRSAINIYPNASLTLIIKDGATLIVDSGYGTDAEANVPGKGGYAGIHVPVGATLNIRGKGAVKAYGGNAGNGGYKLEAATRGAGGGGAGAGIGGHGGKGAKFQSGRGASGGAGEDCGTVNVLGTVTVYAYGGAGGHGGQGSSSNVDATGGGGYPGAGIGGGGGGGAGGTCCAGGGGYSAGTAENITFIAHNGRAGGNKIGSTCCGWGGCGYYESPTGKCKEHTEGTNTYPQLDRHLVCFGGFASWGAYGNPHTSGFGGDGGKGGTVNVASTANVYAYNGNLYTDGTSYENGLNQCVIYAQAGITNAKYDYLNTWSGTVREAGYEYILKKLSDQTTIAQSSYVNKKYLTEDASIAKRYININELLDLNSTFDEDHQDTNPLKNVDMSTQGVGSGAGYNEPSNGTYNIN